MLMRCRWSKEWTCILVIFILTRLRTTYFFAVVIVALLVIFPFPVRACVHVCVCWCTRAILIRVFFPCNSSISSPLSIYFLFPSQQPFYFPLDLLLFSLRGAGTRTSLARLRAGALQWCRCCVLSPASPRGNPSPGRVGTAAAPKLPVALNPQAGLVQVGSAEWARYTQHDWGC